MAVSKQLEIVVAARDEATQAFQQVGNSAGGLRDKLGSLNDLAEAGHGFKKMLRTAEHIGLAFEILPVGLDAVKGLFSSLGGSAEEAAEGQRKLYDGIRELPIVGKLAANAAEGLGAALSHALGRQSTADVEAEVAKKKAIIEEFGKSIEKLKIEGAKEHDEAGLAGLLPGDAAIEKAKETFAKKMAELKEYKAKLVAAAGAQDGTEEAQILAQQKIDNSTKTNETDRAAAEAQIGELRLRTVGARNEQMKRILQDEVDAKKIEAAEIAKANLEIANSDAERYVKELDFTAKLLNATRSREDAIVKAQGDMNAKALEADNRGYEAKQLAQKAATAKQFEDMDVATNKELAELDKQATLLGPKAAAGNQEALQQLAEIKMARADIAADASKQLALINSGGAQSGSIARDEEVRKAKLSSLAQEASAGDTLASLELQRLNVSRASEATERALLAIAHDAKSTDAQRLAANQQLAELKKAQTETTDASLRDSELSILEKQAALGDDNARIKLEQLQSTREQSEAEAKLNDILADRNSTDAQRLQAQQQLNQLKQLGGEKDGKTADDSALFLLKQEESLGDKLAGQQLKKIELEKQYADQRSKLLGIINSETASEQAKANAKQILSGLDATEAKAVAEASKDKKAEKLDNKITLATLEDSRFLTGVSARAEQEQFTPVVNAQNQTTDAIHKLGDTMLAALRDNNKPKKEIT